MRRAVRGVSLVELVAVIVIMASVAAVAGVGFSEAMQSYRAAAQRAELTEMADSALRRVARDLRSALPNSARVTAAGGVVYLEFIATRNGGRYKGEFGDGLGLDLTAADTQFNTFGVLADGPLQSARVNDWIVVNNQTADPVAFPGQSSAYNIGAAPCVGAFHVECATTTIAAPGVSHDMGTRVSTVNMTARRFPADSASRSFFVLAPNPAVTYQCTPGAVDASGNGTGTLRRLSEYTIARGQPTPPGGGTSALLMEFVTACAITLQPIADGGVVYLQITVTRANGTATLYHQVLLPNVN
jgi:MSHA biogenesis protein MshO